MSTIKHKVLAVLRSWEFLLVVLIALAIVVCASKSPYFLQARTITSLTADLSEKAVMVLAMTLVIISGEIDLSVASVLGLSSVCLGLLYEHGCPMGLAIVLCLVMGVCAGLFNALFVVKLKLPSLVVTLGTMALFRGLSAVLIGDNAVSSFPDSFTNVGILNVPNTIIPITFAIPMALSVVIFWLLHMSYFGRQIYSIGLNPIASRFSGIPVDRIKTFIFALSGLFAAIAGIIFTARYSSSRSDNGLGFELDVITMALLGGVSIFGGKGRLIGVFLAAILVGTLRKGLALADVPNEMHDVVIGMLLIFAVLGPNLTSRFTSYVKSRKGRTGVVAAEASSKGN